MDKRIIRFLKRATTLTLATSTEGKLWCAPLFFAYDSERNWLIFTSSKDSLHVRQGLKNPKVAASIIGRSQRVSRLRGAQITGTLKSCSPETLKVCKGKFTKKFPFTLHKLRLDDMWYIEIETVKYTDNRLGFSTKLYY